MAEVFTHRAPHTFGFVLEDNLLAYRDLILDYVQSPGAIPKGTVISSGGQASHYVYFLREGLVKIRVFRPFPKDELAAALCKVKAVAVMDKAESFNGQGGPLYAETCAALYGKKNAPMMVDYIYGLGGRDVRVESIRTVYEALEKIVADGEPGETYRYLDVRE